MAWDQALNDMAIEYIASTKAHISTHLAARASSTLKHLIMNELGGTEHRPDGVGRTCIKLPDTPADQDGFFIADAYDALEVGVKASHNLPTSVRSLVEQVRSDANVPAGKQLSKLGKTVTFGTLKVHAAMAQQAIDKGRPAWSLCPVVTTGRTFMYIDERVASALLCMPGPKPAQIRPDCPNGLTLLEQLFGVHRAAWNAASKVARKAHRKSASGRKHKRRCGYGSFPKGWSVHSLMTDGVALCAVLSKPVPLPVVDLTKSKVPATSKPTRRDISKPNEELATFLKEHHDKAELHLIAEDTGRKQVSTSTQVDCHGKHITHVLRREALHRRSLQDTYRRLEQEKRQSTPGLVNAIDSLGGESGTWRCLKEERFAAQIARLAAVHSVLVAAYVVDPWYALWRMRLWRRKRSVMMQFYGSVVQAAPANKKVIFASGDGGFAATGRGERAVPTSGARADLRRVLKARLKRYDHNLKTAVAVHHAVHTYVCEGRTTMTCHKCGTVVRDVIDPTTKRPVHGLKLCPGCRSEHCGHWVKVERVPEDQELDAKEKLMDGKTGQVRGLRLCVAGHRDEGHAHRLLNRDVNAARNIWLVLNALAQGLPRPTHLVIHRKQSKPALTTRPE